MTVRLARARTAVIAVAIALVAACATTTRAPIEERSLNAAPGVMSHSGSDSVRDGASYRVVRGDTLYSIAFRNGLDFRALAAANRIGAPYTIYIGQELKLGATSALRSSVESAQEARPAPTTSASGVTPGIVSVPPPHAAADAPHFENVEPGTVSSAAPTGVTAPPPPPTLETPVVAAPAAAPPTPTVKTPEPAPASSGGEVGWRWPADGTIVGGFVAADQTRQGIDIAGKSGDPVRAAADGTVVYSGNGLIGYGELIIVKHSASLLSAYGHNSKRLVKEGDRVIAGQVIAEMGSSSASRDSLHFEIRKNGKPTNPLDYLPRR